MDIHAKDLEAVIAKAVHQHACGCNRDFCAMSAPAFRPARTILAALTEAGYKLLPPGVGRTEYRVTFLNRIGDRIIWAHCDTEPAADQALSDATSVGRSREIRKEHRTVTVFPDGRELANPWDPPW